MIFITETSDSNSTITQIIPAHLTLLKAVGDTVTSGDLLTSLDVSNHSVHIDLDNDGIADEIRYDTKSQRLFVQQLSDEAMHNRLLVKAWGVGPTAVRQRQRQAKSPIFRMMPQARRRSHCNQLMKIT